MSVYHAIINSYHENKWTAKRSTGASLEERAHDGERASSRGTHEGRVSEGVWRVWRRASLQQEDHLRGVMGAK